MKCISIRQPWAWLIIKGVKPVENRTWSSSYRGPLLIHASLTFDWSGYRWIRRAFPALQLPAPSFQLVLVPLGSAPVYEEVGTGLVPPSR